MARTEYKGPVYGAITVLSSVSKDTVAISQTDLEVFQMDVPADEDWFVTRVSAYCDDAGTVAATVDVEDDGVSILSSVITLVSDDAVERAITADPGEDEGKKVAAGSVLTVDVTSGATTGPSDITVTIEGYRRKIGAPR